MKKNWTEKRLSKRVEIQKAFDVFLSPRLAVPAADTIILAKTKNVSAQGLCALIGCRLNPETAIRGEIFVDAPENKTIMAFYEVRWCRQKEESSEFEAGLEIMAMKREDLPLLRELIRSAN